MGVKVLITREYELPEDVLVDIAEEDDGVVVHTEVVYPKPKAVK